MKHSGRKLFSVFDIIIILVAVIASALALFSQFNSNSQQLLCVVRVEGEVVHTVELSSVVDEHTYQVQGELPVTVVIDSDGAYVESAQCPDKLCEHTGRIEKAGQSIVCLPAKVSVTLESSVDSYDAVVG